METQLSTDQQAKRRRPIKIVTEDNQMSLIRDTEEVTKFLEFAGRKLILNDTAVVCRMTACKNLFSVLNDDEDNLNYILKNLDVLIHRLSNHNPNVSAATLKVYKSRVKSSIEDFKAWSADPFGWERTVSDRAKQTAINPRKAGRKPATRPKLAKDPGPTAPSKKPVTRTISFPVHADLTIAVSLPEDGITLKDLQRLGMFLYPYCTDISIDTVSWPLASKAN